MTAEQDAIMHDILRRIIRSGHGLGFLDLLADTGYDRNDISRAIDRLFDLGALEGEWVRRFSIDEQFGDWYVRKNADRIIPGTTIVTWNGIPVYEGDLPEGITAVAVDKNGRWSIVEDEGPGKDERIIRED